MKKEVYLISYHSFVDLVTNSSTEIFMLETDKALDLVREIIRAKENEFPPEYGGCTTTIDYPDDYFLNTAFGWYTKEDEEAFINYLEGKGYTITSPKEESKPKYICISTERGYMNPDLHKFIIETFNVIYHDTEA